MNLSRFVRLATAVIATALGLSLASGCGASPRNVVARPTLSTAMVKMWTTAAGSWEQTRPGGPSADAAFVPGCTELDVTVDSEATAAHTNAVWATANVAATGAGGGFFELNDLSATPVNRSSCAHPTRQRRRPPTAAPALTMWATRPVSAPASPGGPWPQGIRLRSCVAYRAYPPDLTNRWFNPKVFPTVPASVIWVAGGDIAPGLGGFANTSALTPVEPGDCLLARTRDGAARLVHQEPQAAS